MSQNGMYELFKQSVNMCVHLMYKEVYVIANETLKKIFSLTVLHFFLNWTVKTLISKCFISARVYVNMQT